MDYHHLESLPPSSFEGVYTMETFVHATDPEAVLAGFFRPGGRVALFEYDHDLPSDAPPDMAASMRTINKYMYAVMPTNKRSNPGVFKGMLSDAGFKNVVVRDLSENVRPILSLFFTLAVVPWRWCRICW